MRVVASERTGEDNQMRAEIEHLRQVAATLEERVKSAEVDRDEWKAKAKSLANNFLGALKGIKAGLFAVKRDQQKGMSTLRAEFDDRLRFLVNQISSVHSTTSLEQRPRPHQMSASLNQPMQRTSDFEGSPELDQEGLTQEELEEESYSSASPPKLYQASINERPFREAHSASRSSGINRLHNLSDSTLTNAHNRTDLNDEPEMA